MRRRLRLHEVSNTARSGELKFTPDQLKGLSQKLVGRIVLQPDAGYSSARASFANAFQRFPQIIVYCEGFADVVACLHFARDAGLEPVCRAGGHSTAAFSVNDEMVIDVSGLNYVKVDPQNAVAWAGAGANFAQVDATLELFDLHVPGGGCDTVGVAGFMQGGGYGLTSQMFGMNCDHVTSFQMALADGRIVTASERENPDLFWAVRGGTGNNFGVLLEIEYRLHRLKKVSAFGFRWPISTAKEAAAAGRAFHAWQTNFTSDAVPPDLGSEAMLIHSQASPDKPVEPFFMIRGLYRGSQAECRKALEPLFRSIPGAGEHRDIWRRGTYREMNEYLFNYPTELPPNLPAAARSLAKSHIVGRYLGQKECREVIEFYRADGNPDNFIGFEPYGGAINAVAPEATAFWHRRATMDVFFFSFWLYESAREKAESAISKFDRVLGPLSNGQSYQNYPHRDVEDFGRAYFGGNLERLLKVKKQYDPENFFTFPQGLGRISGPGAARVKR